MSAKDKEQRIRERAYHLWQADGEPHGRSSDYWAKAEAMEDAPAATSSSTMPSDGTATSPNQKRKASAPKQKGAKTETSAAAPPAKPARRTRTPAPKG